MSFSPLPLEVSYPPSAVLLHVPLCFDHPFTLFLPRLLSLCPAHRYVVLAGRLVGETVVMGEARPRVRVVGKGNSVNVLAVLGVWHRCVETVTAAVETESYAVSSSDFANLFTAEADISAFERMQWFEQVRAPFLKCFICIVHVVDALKRLLLIMLFPFICTPSSSLHLK